MTRSGWVLCLISALLTIGCAASREDRVNQLKSTYPQWDQSTAEKVADQKVEVGMTEEMVRAGMGKPWSTTRTGDDTRWEYSRFEMDHSGVSLPRTSFYVSFRNGRVTGTQGDISQVTGAPGDISVIW